ncbi:cytosolic sulfotransferase 8-like [Hordeum vulgare subsp. vulgare]|uniref:Sulfotransferase n=1 Tax=Hordeum vulgare subsp. vulgare TaxID=112509 RepID=A0A8I7B4C4_HORVV|nr:cytosolic sulfotransferase 8-like [Hordeum vulgare subsp. vulgare]
MSTMTTPTPSASCFLVGPVPFKDVAGPEDDNHITPPEECGHIISTLPTIAFLGRFVHHQYQGAWVIHERLPGVLSFQRSFTPRPGDVLLASPPKCGTTWLKALSFAIMARAAYPPTAGDHPLLRLNPHECVPFIDDLFSAGQDAKLEALPSPRLMNTHMHHSLLPASVAVDPNLKVVYICREPKDMLVSMWHFGNTIHPCDFSDMFESVCEGKSPDGPIWDHVLGYWRASKASPERVLFLRYEEMLLNPVESVMKLAGFLGVPFSAVDEVAGLPADIVKLCSIDTMKGLQVNKTGASGLFYKFQHKSYFRKGATGDWVNHMTPEMAQRLDDIFEYKLRGSGLSFSS